MDIDTSDLTSEDRGLVLGTVMVCDWNLVAWIISEAFRGENNLPPALIVLSASSGKDDREAAYSNKVLWIGKSRYVEGWISATEEKAKVFMSTKLAHLSLVGSQFPSR